MSLHVRCTRGYGCRILIPKHGTNRKEYGMSLQVIWWTEDSRDPLAFGVPTLPAGLPEDELSRTSRFWKSSRR